MQPETKQFYRKLFALVLPIAAQNLMSAFVSASDAIMLGRLNQDSLSAVSLATQVTFVLSLFYAALTIGTTILSAQYWGKGDKASVEAILTYVTKLSLNITVIFYVAAYFTPELFMRIFTSDETLIAAGAEYLQIVSFSYLFMAVSQIYLCIMKNSGRTLRSTIYSMVSMCLNLILNTILIFGLLGFPQGGIAGAAQATVIARFVEVLLVVWENRKRDVVRLRLFRQMPIPELLRKDFEKFTGPVLANELVWGCGFTMFTIIMGHLGSDAVAANSYANIVKNLISCFCMGIGAGSGILIGNELGNGNLEKAKRDGGRLCRLSLGAGVLSGLFILALRPLILGQVSNLTGEAVEYLSVMLLICAYYMIGKSVNSVTVAGIFCAGGDTKFGFWCDTITMWGLVIPLGLAAAFVWKLPVVWVYFLLNLDELVKLPVVYRHYKRNLWVKNITKNVSYGG